MADNLVFLSMYSFSLFSEVTSLPYLDISIAVCDNKSKTQQTCICWPAEIFQILVMVRVIEIETNEYCACIRDVIAVLHVGNLVVGRQ